MAKCLPLVEFLGSTRDPEEMVSSDGQFQRSEYRTRCGRAVTKGLGFRIRLLG